jgi:hypothetical protein
MSTENYTPSLDEMVFFEDDVHSKNLNFDGEDPTSGKETGAADNTETDAQETITDSGVNSNDSTVEESDDADNQYAAQYNYLKELGLILVEEDFQFDGTPESLEVAVEKTKQNMELAGATSIWNKLPDDFKVILEYALAGGTDIKQVQNLLVKEINYDSVDLEDEGHQEQIIRAHLKKTTKFDDRKIASFIGKLKTAGALEEEAESALNELKSLDQQEKQELIQRTQQEQVERQQRLVQSYNTYVEAVNKMQGIDNRRKQQLVQAVWAPAKYGEHDNVSYFNYVHHLATSNPEHLAQLAQIYMGYDPEKGFVNNQLLKQAESKVTAKLKDTFDKFDAMASGKAKMKDSSQTSRSNSKTTEADKLAAFWSHQQNN